MFRIDFVVNPRSDVDGFIVALCRCHLVYGGGNNGTQWGRQIVKIIAFRGIDLCFQYRY